MSTLDWRSVPYSVKRGFVDCNDMALLERKWMDTNSRSLAEANVEWFMYKHITKCPQCSIVWVTHRLENS